MVSMRIPSIEDYYPDVNTLLKSCSRYYWRAETHVISRRLLTNFHDHALSEVPALVYRSTLLSATWYARLVLFVNVQWCYILTKQRPHVPTLGLLRHRHLEEVETLSLPPVTLFYH